MSTPVQPASTTRQLLGDARDLLSAAWRLDRGRLVAQVLMLLGTGLTGGVSMLLLIPIVNAVAGESGGSSIPVPVLGDLDITQWPLAAVLACVVVAVALQALLTRAQAIGAVRLQQAVVDRMRAEAFDAVLNATWSFVLGSRRSDITEIVTSGASRAGAAFNTLLTGAVTFVIALVTAAVSFAVAPAITGIIVVGLVVVAAGLMVGVRPSHALGRLFGERNRVLQSVMAQSMDSLRLVRAHDSAQVWKAELGRAFASTRDVQVANARRTATMAAVTQIGLVVCASALILVALALSIPAATIVIVLLLALRMVRSVQGLARSAQVAANLLPGVRDLRALTDDARAAAEVPAAATEPDWDPVAKDGPLIGLRDVTFVHASSDRGVRELDFDVPAGRITALVGASGAGKSTTADIVLGLLAPQSGEVVVAGRTLAPELLPQWRRHLAYVPQETVLIPGSVRRNLTWSTPWPCSDEECWGALGAASADFVTAYADGLDTEIGDGGMWLSGGQRQRLALARALLRRPRLLVLDEATSSLDDETERAILDLIRGLVPAVTVLLIAHRTSTIDIADRIVRLSSGRAESVTDRPGGALA